MAEVELRIPLPEELDAHVKERVAQGRYDAAADYVIALIREDKERHLHEDLDRRLLEGLGSEAEEVTPEYLAELRRKVQKSASRSNARGHDFPGHPARPGPAGHSRTGRAHCTDNPRAAAAF